MNRVVIVGGGITGLAAAHFLNSEKPGIEVDLIEAAPRVGGVLRTEQIGPFLVEHSADMFTTIDSAALDLCKKIGFDDQLIGTDSRFQRAFISQGNQLVPVPKGLNLMTPADLDSIRQTTLLSEEGKQRLLQEETIPPLPDNRDECLENFAIRRFGQEAYDKIIQPLVGGIYTADPKKLSLRATLPQYLEMEAQHGSIIAATKEKMSAQQTARKPGTETSGARYNLFMAPKMGMGSLITALKNSLSNTNIITNRRVDSLQKSESGWQLSFDDGDHEAYDAALLTCPSDHAANLIRPIQSHLADLLDRVEYASSAVVVHGFDRSSISHPLDGFGFVVPMSEGRKILAGSFSSVKFAGRAPEDQVITRTFMGGGCQPELLKLGDERLTEIAREELGELLGITGPPLFEKLVWWNNAMPQYHLGHLDLVSDIESAVGEIPKLEIAGKSFRGVGIPACVRGGESGAQRIIESLD